MTSPPPGPSPWLSRHTHLHPDDGCCLMESVSLRAGLPFSDRPRCTHNLVADVAKIVNDALDDHRRQQLTSRAERLTHAHPAGTQASTAIVAAVARVGRAAGVGGRRINRAAAAPPRPPLPPVLEVARDVLYRHGPGRRLIVHIATRLNRLPEPERSHTLVAMLDAAIDAATPAYPSERPPPLPTSITLGAPS